eukprot:COSAG01_NODE_19196_length_1024_cov_5845.204324_1_plen_31_part_10
MLQLLNGGTHAAIAGHRPLRSVGRGDRPTTP